MPDFSTCEIRTPRTPRELNRLYDMLAEVFPVEKDLFQDIASGSRTLYHWEPHTLYQGDEPLGNVSIVMFQLSEGVRLRETAGIASVATPERYRGLGIAKRLMTHVLEAVDAKNLPSILFTSLPRVYAGLGYQCIDQGVKQAAAKPVSLADRLTVRRLTRLDDEALKTMAALYAGLLSHDGKLFRDPEYWRTYGAAANASDKTEFAFCSRGYRVRGYARVEYENDRVLLNEFHAPVDSHGITAALWNWACLSAEEKGLDTIALALPATHGLWSFLQHNGVEVERETGVDREFFMTRMPMRERLKWLADLRWPLSDKF